MLPLWNDVDNGVRVVRLTEAEEIDALIRLFENIAAAESWQPDGALRLWQNRSVYFALQLHGQIVGGLQLVLPDFVGMLPCQTVWPEVLLEPSSRCAHVAILALDESARGLPLLFWRLSVEMWRYSVGEGISSLFIEVTPRILPIYRRLGWPLKVAGERRRHWGEDCYLCTLSVPEVAEALLRRAEHSPYYREIIAQAFRVTLTTRDITGPGQVKESASLYAVC